MMLNKNKEQSFDLSLRNIRVKGPAQDPHKRRSMPSKMPHQNCAHPMLEKNQQLCHFILLKISSTNIPLSPQLLRHRITFVTVTVFETEKNRSVTSTHQLNQETPRTTPSLQERIVSKQNELERLHYDTIYSLQSKKQR